MVLFSFNKSRISVRWEGFSLYWYEKLFQTPEILEAFEFHFLLHCLPLLLSVVIGTLFVVASVWKKSNICHGFFMEISCYPRL